MITKLKGMIKKNQAKATALLTGNIPSFVYGKKTFKDIPVFCCYSAQYLIFEKHLQFL